MVAAKRLSMATPRRQSVASAEREVQRAVLEATLDDLAALVRILRRTGGYMAPDDQVTLRAAQARLVAHGRSVDDAPTRGTR